MEFSNDFSEKLNLPWRVNMLLPSYDCRIVFYEPQKRPFSEINKFAADQEANVKIDGKWKLFKTGKEVILPILSQYAANEVCLYTFFQPVVYAEFVLFPKDLQVRRKPFCAIAILPLLSYQEL
jgi:hypothetical protein